MGWWVGERKGWTQNGDFEECHEFLLLTYWILLRIIPADLDSALLLFFEAIKSDQERLVSEV